MRLRNDNLKKIAITFFLFLIVLAFLPFIGIIHISPWELLSDHIEMQKQLIFWEIRVPRLLLAAIVGAGLSIAGLVTQAILRNPLATPYTLGISGGSAFGAVIAIKLGWSYIWFGLSPVVILAFSGAIITSLIIYLFAMTHRRVSALVLILAGVTISYMLGALNLFIQFIADFTETRQMVRWMMGGLETVGYQNLAGVAVPVVFGIIFVMRHAKDLNVLSLGDELAQSKGVDVTRLMRRLFFISALIIAAIVSVAGPIGFIGLIVPHALRLWLGPDNRYLIPASVFGGALFLMISDTIARTILAPIELPVGVLTAIIGGPFFIFLLLKRRKEILE